MSVDVEALQSELAGHKKRANDLSADNLRLRREVGDRDNQLQELAAVKAENDRLSADVANLLSQLKAADASLAAAARENADNAAKVAAAEKIKAGIQAL